MGVLGEAFFPCQSLFPTGCSFHFVWFAFWKIAHFSFWQALRITDEGLIACMLKGLLVGSNEGQEHVDQGQGIVKCISLSKTHLKYWGNCFLYQRGKKHIKND